MNVSLPFVSAGKSVSVANKCTSGEGTAVNPAGSHLRPKMVLNGAAPQGTGKCNSLFFFVVIRN